MEIRPARGGELARVGDLTAQAYLADDLIADDDRYVDELRSAYRRAQEAEVLVAALDTAVVGTVTLAAPGSPWAEIAQDGELEMRMLAVDPGQRGRKTGARLVRALLERARDQGARSVVLSTLEEMRAARRLYEQMGFRRVPDRDWEIDGRPMHVYELAIADARLTDDTDDTADADPATDGAQPQAGEDEGGQTEHPG